jgi:hypothetical protein
VTLPEPKPGLVVRYSFLWSHEAFKGALEGSKDRPCAIIVALRRQADGEIQTIVAPITHSPPDDPQSSLEIPAKVCRSLGLDDARHWLRFDELNSFLWPGYDLRPKPGKGLEYDYGLLPEDLFERLRKGIMESQKLKKTKLTSRDD